LAIEAFEAAISQKKNHQSAWSNMGLLYENMSMFIINLILWAGLNSNYGTDTAFLGL